MKESAVTQRCWSPADRKRIGKKNIFEKKNSWETRRFPPENYTRRKKEGVRIIIWNQCANWTNIHGSGHPPNYSIEFPPFPQPDQLTRGCWIQRLPSGGLPAPNGTHRSREHREKHASLLSGVLSRCRLAERCSGKRSVRNRDPMEQRRVVYGFKLDRTV